MFLDHQAHSFPPPAPLPSSKAGAQQDKEGHLEVFQGKVSLPRSLLPDTLKVDRGRCARRTVSFPHAHVPSISQHHWSLNSLGSVDPLKGQSPRPLETPSVLRLAFVLHLVGEERCQGKDWDLVHNRAHSGVCSLTVVLKHTALPGFGVPNRPPCPPHHKCHLTRLSSALVPSSMHWCWDRAQPCLKKLPIERY